MQQFKYGDIRIAVDRATVRDQMRANVIATKAQSAYKESDWGLWPQFGRLCALVRKQKGLPFDPMKLSDADEAAVIKAYEQFLDLDDTLRVMWSEAVRLANEPVPGSLAPESAADDALNW